MTQRIWECLRVLALGASLAGCGGGGDSEVAPVPAIPGRTFGGAGSDFAWSVQQTADLGFIFAGFTSSRGAGGFDAWVVKLDASGQVVQEQTFGGTANDFAFSIQQTGDGGYILAGVDDAVGGTPPSAGSWLPTDIGGALTLRKLNADLSLAWERKVTDTLVGSVAYPYAMGYAVQATSDGGYIVAGATGTGGGGGQTLLLKTTATGTVAWYVYLDGELGTGVSEATDGGFCVSTTDGGLIRTSSAGLVAWTQTLGGSGLSVGRCSDGTFATAGGAPANAGDVYVARVAFPGGLAWDRSFGSAGGDLGCAIQQTTDGGFVVAGAGGSARTPNHRFDLSLYRLDAAGTTLWESYAGDTGDEVGRCVRQTSDGGFIAAGSTTSKGAGGVDAYLIRTDASGAQLW